MIELGLASVLLISFRIGRREARLLHDTGGLPLARLRPSSTRDRLRLYTSRAADLSHALFVALGLASLAGTALALALG
ncbi:MAG TPA: hypothetical protein VMZ28_06975 [Kofleriaceae bacterium]|nr:hypothetical protein [Kofleriaceae bacterium]